MRERHRTSWVLFFSLAGNVWTSAIGYSAPREDNPLPDGAVVRLGNRLFRHEGYIYSLAFSPDGKLLAAAADDGNVYLWQAETGKRVRCLPVAPCNSTRPSIAFSPDGKRLAMRNDGEVSFWDIATGKKLVVRRIAAYVNLYAPNPVPVCFSPDGKQLYVAVESGKKAGVAAVDTAADGKVRYLGMSNDAMDSLALSQDGKTLALGLCDAAPRGNRAIVRLLDTATGKILRVFSSSKSPFDTVYTVAFSPDGNSVAWIGGEKSIILGDLKTGEQVVVPDMSGTQFVFTPDGKTLISNEPGDKVCFWDLTRKRRTRALDRRRGNWRCLALSPDGRLLAAAGGDRVVEVWDLRAEPKKQAAILGHDRAVVSVAFSPDGKRMLSGDARKQVRLWDATNGRPLQSWKTSGGLLVFAPDGKRFASARSPYSEDIDPVAHVWDVATGKELYQFRHEVSYAVSALAFSRDDKFVITAAARMRSGDRPPRQTTLHVWDSATGRRLRDHFLYRGETETASGVVLSSDGRTVAFGGEIGECSPVWIASVLGRCQPLLLPGSKNWLPLALSVDGKLLATRTWKYPLPTKEGEKAIYLWETATGKEILPKPLQGRLSLVLSPDGRFAAAADDWAGLEAAKTEISYHLRLYDLASGKEIRRFHADSGYVASLAFSPDGSRLASGLGDGTVLLWDVSTLREAVRAKGELAAEELRRYWTDLADDEARKAYRAICFLSDDPRKSVAFLRERLVSAGLADPPRVRQLIADLDSDEFLIRERAQAKLDRFSDVAEPALRDALRQRPSLEARRRIVQLLDKLENRPLASNRLRSLRALTILERIGDAGARQVLSKLAAGQPDVRLTQEAKAALERLGMR